MNNVEIVDLNGKIEKEEEKYRTLSNKKNILSRRLDKMNFALLVFIGCSGLGSLVAIASGSSLVFCLSFGLLLLDLPMHLIRNDLRKKISEMDKELSKIDNKVRDYQSDLYNIEVNRRIECEKREFLNSRLYNRELSSSPINKMSNNKNTFRK